VEEVFLAIGGGNKTKATIGGQLLDCSALHLQISSCFSNLSRTNVVGPFEKKEDASAKRARHERRVQFTQEEGAGNLVPYTNVRMCPPSSDRLRRFSGLAKT
jgi:hypothetical protein